MKKDLRIIDANLNRASEGLRVLEDIARFTINDEYLSSSLKDMRHNLSKAAAGIYMELIDARDVAADWGSRSIELSKREDLLSVVAANARRAEEGLRVIEELAKTDKGLNPADFKKARFDTYEIEKRLSAKISRKQRSELIKGLYVVIDIGYIGKKDPYELASSAIAGGARIIQLRHKSGDKKELYEIGTSLKKACIQNKALFIINDHIDVAMACDADGVHLGQSDLPVNIARKLMPVDRLIGCSASTIREARQAEKYGADYIAVGSIFPTNSKDDIDVVGIERLRKIKAASNLPVVAIGGINRENMKTTVDAGADSIAVISAVLGSPDVEKAAALLASAFFKPRKKLSK